MEVNEFNEETAPKIFGGDIQQHILIFIGKSDESYEATRTEFAAAAKGHKGPALHEYFSRNFPYRKHPRRWLRLHRFVSFVK